MKGAKDETPAEVAPESATAAPSVAVPSDDPFETLAEEIASMLRSTKEACQRIEAQAEERAAHTVEEAGAQAQELITDAETTAATERSEAEAAAQSLRDEAQQLLDEAGRARDTAAATLARSRRLLADAERELAKSIDQANAMRTALEAIRTEAMATDDGEVIDLTDADTGASQAAAPPPPPPEQASSDEASGEQPAGEKSSGEDQLDGAVRNAVARAVEGASNAQDPSA